MVLHLVTSPKPVSMLYFFSNRPRHVPVENRLPLGGSLREGAGRGPGGALRRAFPWLILGVTLVGLLGWRPLRGFLGRSSQTDTPYSHEHQRLLESIGTTRPVAAYLAGGLSYGPYHPRVANRRPERKAPTGDTTRGKEAPAANTSSKRLPPDISLAIRKARDRNRSPESQGALAVLDLIDGDPKNAVSLLREAHTQRPSDPRFLNDLAAASLALYDDTGDPWAALEAVEVAAQADRLEPSAPARFNLAFALERLNVRVRAIAAWERYLELDSLSPWAQEAEQHLEGLKAAVAKSRKSPQLTATPAANVTDFPDNSWARRQLGERVLLTRWAERTLAHQPAEAEEALIQAERLAATLTPDGGRLLKESIGTIREAENSGDRERLGLLARGHQVFGQAFLRYREERIVEARGLIAGAIQALRSAGSPFELRARVLRAWMVEEPDWDELRQISEEAEDRGYAAIAAEERRIAAYRMNLEGHRDASSDVYLNSQQRYAVLGEWEMKNLLSIMRTEELADLGRDLESSSEIATALTAGLSMADPWNRYSLYVVAAVATSSRFSRAAVELRLEAADVCRDLRERPLCLVDSWMEVADLTPDTGTAEDALHRADALLSKLPSSDGRERSVLDLTMARARWFGGKDRDKSEREDAVALYAEAAKRYEARNLALSASDAHARRARLLKELGHSKEAISEYRVALEIFRLWDQNDRFRPERAERRSPAVLRNTYEALIGIELDLAGSHVCPNAFLLSEEMRDRLAPRRTIVLTLPKETDLPRFVDAIPRGTAIVEYALFEGRSEAWILTDGHLQQVSLSPPHELDRSIISLRKERSLEGWKSTTSALYQSFVAPILEFLPAETERLVLVPDSQLYGIPFSALWNPKAGRYLAEDFTVSLAPSVSQLLSTRIAQPVEVKPEVLSLGFSHFLPHLHLGELPHAEEEAAAVLSLYGLHSNSCSVTDWKSFCRCAPQADVIHLATHAAADSELGWLAFPGETPSVQTLWKELPDLPRHPLVVLASCQSSAVTNGGEGLGGLARPFLASGARAVIGSLWEMNDVSAWPILSALHKGYMRNSKLVRRGEHVIIRKWAREPWRWGGIEILENSVDFK
jgi:tetratricopeptide (TPR) repeat protein